MKVLFELRPCLEPYSGIAQDARLVFLAATASDGIAADGLLNSRNTATQLWSPGTADSPLVMRRAAVADYLIRLLSGEASASVGKRVLQNLAGVPIPLVRSIVLNRFRPYGVTPVDTAVHEDAIWDLLFSPTLPESARRPLMRNRYFATPLNFPAYVLPAYLGTPRARLDTKGWDAFVHHAPASIRLAPGTRLVIRYHDSIPITHPHTVHTPALHAAHHARALRDNVAGGAVFFCNSEATASELQSIAGVGDQCLRIVNCAVAPVFTPRPAMGVGEILKAGVLAASRAQSDALPDPAALARSLEPFAERPYFLAVGTLEPRKNHELALAAMRRAFLGRPGDRRPALVLVGNPGWRSERLQQQLRPAIAAGDVVVLQRVGGYELSVLYSNALACLSLSKAEGFSYSGVESLACGTPVIASDIPVHREIYGAFAEYVSPYSSAQAADAIQAAFDSGGTRDPDAVRARSEFVTARYSEGKIAGAWEQALLSL